MQTARLADVCYQHIDDIDILAIGTTEGARLTSPPRPGSPQAVRGIRTDPMQAPTGMHPTLLTGWQLAERVRGELLAVSSPLTPAQWRHRPDAGSWCIAEVVDHLLRAEIGTSKMVRKLIRGDYATWRMPAGARLYTAALDRYPYGQLTAPQELNPGPARDRAELEGELGVAHARFRKELAQFRGQDPEALRSADPATGVWYTLGGWVKLQAWHEAHHVSQIRSIQAAPAGPG